MAAIRPSVAQDSEPLFDIWLAAVRATHHFLSEDDLAFFAALMRDTYLPNAPLWVATDEEGKALGFMGLTDDKMDALFIHPTAAGKGIGRALVEHALASHPRLLVDVNEQNEGARGFYRHMGFHVIGRSARDDSGRPYPILHLVHEPGKK